MLGRKDILEDWIPPVEFLKVLQNRIYTLKQTGWYAIQLLLRIHRKYDIIAGWQKLKHEKHLPLISDFFNPNFKEIIFFADFVYGMVYNFNNSFKESVKNNPPNKLIISWEEKGYWDQLLNNMNNIYLLLPFLHKLDRELEYRLPDINDNHTLIRCAYDAYLLEMNLIYPTPKQRYKVVGYPTLFPPEIQHSILEGPYCISVPTEELYRVRYLNLNSHEYFHGYLHRLRGEKNIPSVFADFVLKRETYEDKFDKLVEKMKCFHEIEADMFSLFFEGFGYFLAFFERYYISLTPLKLSIPNKRGYILNEASLRVLLMIFCLIQMNYEELLKANGFIAFQTQLEQKVLVNEFTGKEFDLKELYKLYLEIYSYYLNFYSCISPKSSQTPNSEFNNQNFFKKIESQDFEHFQSTMKLDF